MTTKHSPLSALKAQADKIASMIKAAEQGKPVDARFDAKIGAARDKPSFKVGVVMDDQIITLEMPWTVIRASSEASLSEYLLKQMREVRDNG